MTIQKSGQAVEVDVVGSVLAARVVVSKPLTSLEFRLSLVHALTQPLLATRLGPGRTPSTRDKVDGETFPISFRTQKAMCRLCVQEDNPTGKNTQRDKNQDMVSQV